MNTNSKIRFKKSDFKQKLDSARSYKRKSAGSKQNLFKNFRIQIAFASLLLCLPLYVFFVPNFLFIKQIEVFGLKIYEREAAEKSVRDFFEQNKVWPQKNLLLLDKKKLTEFLTRQNLYILNLTAVEKDYPNTLKIYIEPRYPEYIIKGQNSSYEISSDGILVSIKNPEDPLAPTLKEIALEPKQDWVIGQQAIDKTTLFFLNSAYKDFEQLGLNPTQLIPPQAGETTLQIKTVSGLLIKFEATSDWQSILKNFKALLSQLPNVHTLEYIDLRVPERAYVCQKNSPCVNSQSFPSYAPSTTTKESNLP